MARNSRSDNAEERSQLLPTYTVDLDAGVFHWLHEIVQAKERTTSSGVRSVIPSYADLLKRASLAFDTAAVQHETVEPEPVRRIKRREPAAAQVDSSAKGRIKRRPR